MGINNQKGNQPQGQTSWWAPAVEIFSEVSTWIAGPIIFALIVGKYLDGRYDTKPWFFIGLTVIAFIISSYGIVRAVTKYMKKLEIENKNDITKEQK